MEPAATPMLRQYQEIKSSHQDCILFFRLGDFYEMFYDDARTASRVLELVLTARGSDASGKVPMCGVPFHSADNYIARLVRAGHKVAICDQTEDPSQAKGIVRREVVRIITAGTFLDDAAEARYIVAIAPGSGKTGFAFTDTATGAIAANEFAQEPQILEALSRIPVYECVFPEAGARQVRALLAHPMLRMKSPVLSSFRDWAFEPQKAAKALNTHFGTHSLAGFGIDGLPLAQAAAGGLLEYLREMNKTPLKHIDHISRYDDAGHMFISPPAYYGLELEALVKNLDGTVSAAGRRLFRSWLMRPLKELSAIRARQEAIGVLRDAPGLRESLARVLGDMPDVEKALSRISCGSWAARDLLAVRQALSCAPRLREAFASAAVTDPLLRVSDPAAIREKLEAAIDPQMPLAKNEGKVIRRGFNAELDELKGLEENGVAWLQNYQAKEIRRSGINSLKVGFNRVFGYYIEITNANLASVPPEYTRKQTLTNGERFITPELKEYEYKILTAQDKILRLEAVLMSALAGELMAHISVLHAFAREAAAIDALTSLAALAARPRWVRPEFVAGRELVIGEGRHPVVEALTGSDFVANDTDIDGKERCMVVLTGPNMAGKSTYIRQNAVLVIMAQMGSFVPAASMRLGCVDKIFTRIGAHDETGKGQSTFMVEMTEAADILNNLTADSLVILDEIGRGTSTYDGLSLAWAIAEFLSDKKVRTFFATHFHELTLLAEQRPGVCNYNVQVREWQDRVIFMHRIVPGGVDDSYGIYVAKLAGMPAGVLARAKTVLAEFEFGGDLKERLRNPLAPAETVSVQGDLFSAARTDPRLEILRERLRALDVNQLTPLKALQALDDLKNEFGN